MRRQVLTATGLCAAMVLASCVTPPIPENYAGPLATIEDTAVSESGSRAAFYSVDEIDGKRIASIVGETQRANAGRGMSLTPVPYQRDVPAGKMTLKLKAQIRYGAPIQEIFNAGTLYSADRTITVSLESNKTYVVKGVLTSEREEVWLEDRATGARVE